MTERFPSLRQCLDRDGVTRREAMELFRAALRAAVSWPSGPDPTPPDLLDDLRTVISHEGAGHSLRAEAAKQFSRLSNEGRN